MYYHSGSIATPSSLERVGRKPTHPSLFGSQHYLWLTRMRESLSVSMNCETVGKKGGGEETTCTLAFTSLYTLFTNTEVGY